VERHGRVSCDASQVQRRRVKSRFMCVARSRKGSVQIEWRRPNTSVNVFGSGRITPWSPFPGGLIPPPWPEVPALVSGWLSDAPLLAGSDESTLPEAVASLHARFEQIHPFLDGNGRAGRLTLNLLLVRLGYPPAIIYKGDRSRYLAALRRADQGDPGPLGELLARGSSTTSTSSSSPRLPAPPGSLRQRSPRGRDPRTPEGGQGS
jgi:hypothetical protein